MLRHAAVSTVGMLVDSVSRAAHIMCLWIPSCVIIIILLLNIEKNMQCGNILGCSLQKPIDACTVKDSAKRPVRSTSPFMLCLLTPITDSLLFSTIKVRTQSFVGYYDQSQVHSRALAEALTCTSSWTLSIFMLFPYRRWQELSVWQKNQRQHYSGLRPRILFLLLWFYRIGSDEWHHFCRSAGLLCHVYRSVVLGHCCGSGRAYIPGVTYWKNLNDVLYRYIWSGVWLRMLVVF